MFKCISYSKFVLKLDKLLIYDVADAYYKICIDGKFDAISYMDDGTYFAFRSYY